MSKNKHGYKQPKTDSALYRHQVIIHRWEKLRVKYGPVFDKISKTEKITEIHDQIGVSPSYLVKIINAYIKGQIKYQPDIFAGGEPETISGV